MRGFSCMVDFGTVVYFVIFVGWLSWKGDGDGDEGMGKEGDIPCPRWTYLG